MSKFDYTVDYEYTSTSEVTTSQVWRTWMTAVCITIVSAAVVFLFD